MISLKSPAEIEKMRRANRIVAEVLAAMRDMAVPGISTMDLEQKARKILKSTKAKPAFLGYSQGDDRNPYPAVLCTSVNDEVVHGIPNKHRVLMEGDIVSIDFGVELDGYFGDSATSFGIGKITPEREKLLTVTRDALNKAIKKMCIGNHLADVSQAVQRHVEGNNFSVVKQFVGHGIGRAMHEPPQVPNFGTPRPNVKFREGLVLAIEPMVNIGDYRVRVKDDAWTVVTMDGSCSAHFEHSVAVTANGPDVLSLL